MADDAAVVPLILSERSHDDGESRESEMETVTPELISTIPDSDHDMELFVDRTDSAALASLFTERTDDENGPVEVVELSEMHAHDEEVMVEFTTENEPDDHVVMDPIPPDEISSREETMELPPSLNRMPTPVIDSSPLEELPKSPTRPSVPARPPRPISLTPSPSQQPLNVSVPPLQLLTFDVGGKLFRCKASLIHKFPTKRLHHVVSCGCEQIDHATFFIDRNPQHFELVLDWYRTGKCPKPFPPHINEDAFRDDAKYFDLYDELFPTPTPVPPRDITPPVDTTTLPRLPDRPPRPALSTPLASPPSTAILSMEKKSMKTPPSDGLVRYSKRDVRLVTTADVSHVPTWFCVQDHEHLVVESVKGSGKLFVRVTDMTGMIRVFVDQAVLFDSRSWFYLEDDGHAKLQHCVLPGNHVYTFWMEPIPSEVSSPPPPQAAIAKAKQSGKGKNNTMSLAVPPTIPELEVVFRLVSTFVRADEMENDNHLVPLLSSKGKGWGEASSTIPSSTSFECLFLPPRSEPAPALSDTRKQDVDMDVDARDAIAEQIRALAAKDLIQKTSIVPETNVSSGNMSTLKRNGAAIAQKPTKVGPIGHGSEKVTVYQPMPPRAATPRSPVKSTPTYSSQQPRQFRQR